MLLLIALVHFAYGILAFLVAQSDAPIEPDGAALARIALVQNAVIGVIFVAFWRIAGSAPATAIFVASTLWFLLQVANVALNLVAIFAGLWVKAVVLILLIRGIVAGIQASRFLRRLTALPPHEPIRPSR